MKSTLQVAYYNSFFFFLLSCYYESLIFLNIVYVFFLKSQHFPAVMKQAT